MNKEMSNKCKQKESGMTILISDRVELKVKSTKQNKEEHRGVIKDNLWGRNNHHKPACSIKT